MSSLVTTPPLGSKENPHIMVGLEPRKINRISGHWYLYKGNLRYCDNQKRLINKERDKEYRKENKEKIALRCKKWMETGNNREKVLEKLRAARKGPEGDLIRAKDREKWKNRDKDKVFKQRKAGRERNADTIKISKKKYAMENKDKINEYNRNRYHNDITLRLIHNQRTSIAEILKKNNLSKNKRTSEYLCCSEIHLKEHIVSQYEEWMNDDNFGVYNPNGPRTWQVDHRVPKAYFKNLKENEEERYMLFHWTNLQPLCSKENIANKRDNFDPKTFRYKWIDREIGWVGIPKYLMNK